MKILIDGKELETEGKKTILEVARENGIYIPSLCDHPRLTPFSGCRLCIIQIKGAKGYSPACSTFIKDGMEIRTKTPKLTRLRHKILELILIEHPSSCLICEEKTSCDDYKSTIRKVGEVTGCVLCPNNGRCQLQDVVEELKLGKIDFPAVYRDFGIKKQDPFFEQNYNLCILCGRCVRMCHQVRGLSTIAFINRGSDTVIGTALDRTLLESNCQFCGACVDVCPTGALAEKSVKYDLLPDNKNKTICPLCSVGCELEVSTREGKFQQARPNGHGTVNQDQACVKGRFTLRDVINDPDRITRPLVRKNKELEAVDWDEALDFVVAKLKKVKGSEIAVIGSEQVSCEDGFVLQKFATEVLKTKNIATSPFPSPWTALQELTAKSENIPAYNYQLDELAEAETIFLLNTDISRAYPVVWLEIFKAVKKGARLIVVSPLNYLYDRFATLNIRTKPGTELLLLTALGKLLAGSETKSDVTFSGYDNFQRGLTGFDLIEAAQALGVESEQLQQAAEMLENSGRTEFVFGPEAITGKSGSETLAALWNLSLMSEAGLYPLGLENNSRGMFELNRSGTFPRKPQRDIFADLESKKIKVLYLAGPANLPKKSKPELLIVQGCYKDSNTDAADVVLPAAVFAEIEGIYVNMEGRIQKSCRVLDPPEKTKADWWIYAQLAVKMGSKDFKYKKSADILKEIKKINPGLENAAYSVLEKGKVLFVQEEKKAAPGFVVQKFALPAAENGKKYPFSLLLTNNLDFYRNMVLSDRIPGFRLFRDSSWFRINPEDAAKLELSEGAAVEVVVPNGKLRGIVRIDESVALGIVAAAPNISKLPMDISSFVLPAKIKRGK